jgi:mono/diheme cytochrome c family protein
VIGTASVVYAQGSEAGKREYLNSCASCHGVTGKGNGPVAQGLKRSPADLTKLSEANKGVFPFSRTYDVIDGRFQVEMHGSREMPVWGQVFQPAWWWGPPVSNETAESIVRVRILALIEYISTLQGK